MTSHDADDNHPSEFNEAARALIHGADHVRASVLSRIQSLPPQEKAYYNGLLNTVIEWDFSNSLPHDMVFRETPNGLDPCIDTFLTTLTKTILDAAPDWFDTANDIYDQTPLMAALEKGYPKLCDALIEKGASLYKKNFYGFSVLECAIVGKCPEPYKLSFLERADQSGILPDQMFLGLVRSAAAEKPALCQFFFDRGADQYRDADEKTAIMCSLEGMNLASVNLLMDMGCTTDALDNEGKSALHHLAQNAHYYRTTDAAEALTISFLRAGLDPDLKDKHGDSPRSIAKSFDTAFMLRAMEWRDISQSTPHRSPGRAGGRL